MSKKYNAEFDTRVAQEFSGKDSYVGGKLSTPLKVFLWILAIVGFIGGFASCTQYFASELSYSPYLGTPVFNIGNVYFYYPWEIFFWSDAREAYPELTDNLISMYYVGSAPFWVLAITIKIFKSNGLKGNRFLNGSARWANKKDIEKMALIPHELTFNDKVYNAMPWHKKKIKEGKSEGVFVGAWEDPKTKKIHYLRHNGPEHILCVAPTRSGKGVGLVNPTLLTWMNSAVITDLKGELHALTSGWRRKYANNYVIRFEPAKERKCVDKIKHLYNVARWNPLDEIRAEGSTEYCYDIKTDSIKKRICDGLREISDTQNIVIQIVDPQGEGLDGSDGFWKKSAYELLVGSVIHLKHNCPDNCNISTLYQMLGGKINTAKLREKRMAELEKKRAEENGDKYYKDDYETDESEADVMDVKNLWEDMAKGLDRDGKPYKANSAVIIAGQHMKVRPDDEGGSVLSTATASLGLYIDPVVAENTSHSDFRIKQIMNSDKPVSLYLVTEPTDKDRLAPLVKLFISLILTLCASDMEFKKGRSVRSYKNKMLLMLDEFPSLGKLEKMQESLAFIAGYGMKAYLITQDMSQLFDKYGKDESISSNCHINIFYAPLKVDTAQIMSDKAGTTTIVEENKSISGSGFKASISRSVKETGRPLITKDECMQLRGPEKNAMGDIVKAGDLLVFTAGQPAIHGIQPLYFQNPTLLHRAQVDAPIATDILLKDGKLISEIDNEKEDEDADFENKFKID